MAVEGHSQRVARIPKGEEAVHSPMAVHNQMAVAVERNPMEEAEAHNCLASRKTVEVVDLRR